MEMQRVRLDLATEHNMTPCQLYCSVNNVLSLGLFFFNYNNWFNFWFFRL